MLITIILWFSPFKKYAQICAFEVFCNSLTREVGKFLFSQIFFLLFLPISLLTGIVQIFQKKSSWNWVARLQRMFVKVDFFTNLLTNCFSDLAKTVFKNTNWIFLLNELILLDLVFNYNGKNSENLCCGMVYIFLRLWDEIISDQKSKTL